MAEQRSKEQILQLFARIGYTFDPELGDHLFYTASNGQEYTSVNSFRNVLNDYLITQGLKK
jgi:hypothetical protein